MADGKAATRAVLRRDLLSFVVRAFSVLHPGQSLHVAWFHEAMAYALECCLQGSRRRQIVTMPPRSLKSMIISVIFPAWLLGRDPTVKIMCVSYSEDLARRHSMAVSKGWPVRERPASRRG